MARFKLSDEYKAKNQVLKEDKIDRDFKAWQKRQSAERNETSLSILKIVILFLLCIAFYRACTAKEPVTFSGFLNYIAEAPQISMPASAELWEITEEWGDFDWLRSIINSFGGLLGSLIYIGGSVINLIIYVGYFIGFLLF